jgi:hypothetical protein
MLGNLEGTIFPLFGVISPFLVLDVKLTGVCGVRLRACDHYTSSTLVGGKGGAGPSSLHTTLKRPTGYVNARWM